MSDQDAMRADLPAPTANDATATTGVPTTYMWNWSANVRANNSELSRSFHVLIFLGSVPKDPREWTGARSYAGAFTAFVAGRSATSASAPLPQHDVVTQGAVGLNRLLEQNGGLRTFDPHVVRPYLKNGLDWRIQMADGTPVPIENRPSLEVTVIATQFEMRDGELPHRVGEPVLYRDLTCGRPGGARSK